MQPVSPGQAERLDPGDQPLISIVIATRDRTESLVRCLDSLLRLDYPAFEVIVVDNAPSSDETRRRLKTYPAGLFRYVREQQPGLAVAHNRGVKEARGSLLAFTDDDVEVDPKWLDELLAGFAAADGVGCVTGRILPAELETDAQLWLEEYGGFSKGESLRVFDLDRHRPGDRLFPYAAGTFGSGANMAFTREALERIGGFDPALGAGSKGMGGDDLAAFFKVITSGYALVYQPAAVVHHWHRRDYRGLRRMAHGYGVGLTAYLTSILLEQPRRVPEILAALPAAAAHVLSPKSPKNHRKSPGFPRQLTWDERMGMLRGPWAYLRSRREVRRQDRTGNRTGSGREDLRSGGGQRFGLPGDKRPRREAREGEPAGVAADLRGEA